MASRKDLPRPPARSGASRCAVAGLALAVFLALPISRAPEAAAAGPPNSEARLAASLDDEAKRAPARVSSRPPATAKPTPVAGLFGGQIPLVSSGAPPRERAAGADALTVVHFWATWCPPCTEELASLVTFYQGPYRELEKRGVRLWTVSNDVRKKDLEQFLKERELPFPVFFDSLRELNEKLGLVELPGTVVIDRDGAVVARLVGVQAWDSREFVQRLEAYLDP